jgi:hypothetical protein
MGPRAGLDDFGGEISCPRLTCTGIKIVYRKAVLIHVEKREQT